MNRLVIIGNGFDLAHGLPTSYRDFINDYWKNRDINLKEDELISLNLDQRFRPIKINSFKELKDKIMNDYLSSSVREDEFFGINCRNDFPFNRDFEILKFKNTFFGLLCNNLSIENWVDVENEYYKLLKKHIKKSSNREIKMLNKEFEEVKNLLEKYLEKEINKTPNINELIIKIFKIRKDNSEEYYKEFPNKYKKELIKTQDGNREDLFEEISKVKTYYLNFNYTRTVDEYIKEMNLFGEERFHGEVHQIYIHGRLNDENNPINFGFGDEVDKDYQEIEEKNDNEYLKNIKSFQYLHTSNYKRLLDFIDSENFQIYIMGHSCGLSDRTLLNTIFEHENSCSIKVFFHKRKDGTDNYTEITQNISRHFNKKKLMREKIVNKTLCEPLPQIQLSKKQ